MGNDLRYRLRALFRKRAMDRELQEELRFHAEQQLRKSLASGLSAHEAARRFRLDFGGPGQIQEECRDARGVALIEDLGRDLAYAWRVLAKSRGFAAVAILILALGIGANTAAFSFVNAILLKQLPVDRPDEVVQLNYRIRGRGPFQSFGYPDFREIEQDNRVFAGMLGGAPMKFHFAAGDTPAEVWGSIVSGHYFPTLGVRAILGRTLTPEDDGTEGAHPVCAISWRFWNDRFGADPSAIGRTVQLDAHPFQIVGVLQRGFGGISLNERSDIFLPMSMQEPFLGMKRDDRGYSWFAALGRLKPGVTIAHAAAVYDALMRRIKPGWTGSLEPVPQGVGDGRKRLGSPVLICLAAVGLLLLIACANLAGLLLARASGRAHEMAIRLSLGATRGRLMRQFLMECALVGAAGCAASLAVSAVLMKLMTSFLEAPNSNASFLVGLDPLVLAFTAALSLITVFGFGLLPAWQATRRLDVSAGLNARPGLGRAAGRLRQVLIVVQLALGMVLLFGAGVLTRSLRQLQTTDIGLDPERVVTLNVDPGKNGYSTAATADFYARLLQQTQRLPGVTSAALSEIGVFSGNMFAAMVRVPGHTARDDEPNNNYNIVTPGYFRTLGTPLLAGRDFTEDDRPGSPLVVIVNDQFVKYYWPGERVVGRHIRIVGKGLPDAEIVGVAKTTRYQAMREDPQIIIYVPLEQKPLYPLTLEARTIASPAATIRLLRGLLRSLDPKLPAIAATLVEKRDATISRERMMAFLSTFLACLAAALVGIGLYGLIAYSVAGRTREIGVRLALGARPGAVTWLFVRQALMLAALGIVIGIPPALLGARFLKSIVFGVPAQDPVAAISACVLLALVAIGAALWPAGRGSRQDPVKALRYE